MPVPYIEADNLEQVVRYLQGVSPATRAAANTAVRKTVNWASTRLAREVAARSGIGPRSLTGAGRSGKARRIYKRFPTRRQVQAGGSVYLGYNPIKTGYVGAIRPWSRGQTPRVRSFSYPGAFVATMPTGHRGIFRRATDPQSQGVKSKRRKLVPRREPRPLSRNKWGITELPIDEVLVYLEQAEDAARKIELEAGNRLRTVLGQELNFRLNVQRRRL